MNKKSLKRIYTFLDWYVLRKLEDPCNNCTDFDCKRNMLNVAKITRKKYQKLDIVDWKFCLRRTKQELKELTNILKLPEFRQFSYKKCVLCKKRFFKKDMELHSESAKKAHKIKMSNGHETEAYNCNLFSLCKKCSLSYTHSKKPLKRGYQRRS